MRKWLIGVLVVLVALPLAGAVLIRYLLSPAMLKRAIERQGSAWVGRPVTVGSAHARLFPTAGIELEDVGVAGSLALEAEQVVIRASLGALLDRRVEDAVLRVSHGRITLADAAGQEGGTSGPPDSPDDESGAPPRQEEPDPRDDGGVTIASVREIVLDDITIAGGGQQLRIDLEGALDGDRFDIRRLTARSGETSLEASGVISSIGRREGDLQIVSPLVNVNEVLAVMGALLPAEAGAGQSSGNSPGAAGPGIGRITATVTVDQGRVLGYEIANLETTAVVTGTTVTADPLAFDLYGGRYTSGLSLSLAELTSFSHKARLEGASVASLAELFGSSGAATGTLAFQMSAAGKGRSFVGAAEHATGTADVRLTEGIIANLDVVRSTFVLLGASPPERGQGERYEQITARLGLSDGWLRAEDFMLHSPDFDLIGRVAVDPTGRLDGNVDVVLSEALSKEAQGTNRDLKLTFEDGRITLPATIGGTLASPRVLPDLNAALERAARNRLETEVEKAKKGAAEEIRKRLEQLFPPRE